MILRTRDINDNMKWKEYNFNEFEVFFSFIKKLINSGDYKALNCFNSFNFESKKIIQRFKDYFNTVTKTSLKEIHSNLHFTSDNPYTIIFYTDRGWTEEEAKQKIVSIQTSNANKFAKKRKLNPQLYDSSNSNQLKWWTKKGYSEDEAKMLLTERQKTFSKKSCIEKYGKENGIKIFNNRQKKWRKAIDEKYDKRTQAEWQRKGAFFSKEASTLFVHFFKEYKNIYKCYLQPYTKEFFIWSDTHFYLYDFCIKDLNLIFEYNGSHVHANPTWPQEKLNTWEHCFNHQNAKDNIAAYNAKKACAEAAGFKVIVLWDSNSIEENSKIISSVIQETLQKL